MKSNPTKLMLPGGSMALLFFIALLGMAGCQKSPGKADLQQSLEREQSLTASLQTGNNYKTTVLVANRSRYEAKRFDPNLLNGWGIAFSPTGTPWVNSLGGHVSLVYNSEGVEVRPPVNIPSPAGATGGLPTGIVFNGSATDFILSNGAPARFLFVGVDGILSGWNGAAGTNALLIKNNAATSAYTGLAIDNNDGVNYLYAADFRAGKIEVFDKNFNNVPMAFIDPNLPADYSPFNIEKVDNMLFVLYAKVGPTGTDQPGMGNGIVSVFRKNGQFVKRFATGGELNSPWGIAKAPAGFFVTETKPGVPAKGIILVGNFGNGQINVFDTDGKWLAKLTRRNRPIALDGLWAITFPPVTATSIDPMRLYFASGPNHEADGMFGYITRD